MSYAATARHKRNRWIRGDGTWFGHGMSFPAKSWLKPVSLFAPFFFYFTWESGFSWLGK